MPASTALEVATQVYSERLSRREQSNEKEIWLLLDQVKDPEIPVLSLWDLGVLTDIQRDKGQLVITITPTYSGCPAMHMMQQDIENVLHKAGIEAFTLRTALSPAWSTDSLSPEGRKAMQEYGIAPPACQRDSEQSVACPRCHSHDTHKISEFGSTACKALYQCNQCFEAFDYFKCI